MQSFSGIIPPERTVELHSDRTIIQHATYLGDGHLSLLPKLIPDLAKVASSKQSGEHAVRTIHGGLADVTEAQPDKEGEVILHDEFWPLWATFFEKNDLYLSEFGCSSFGLVDIKMPSGSDSLTQMLWGSIGWATGATLGAAMAAREQGRRCLLFAGDGSIVLSIQDISTIIRQDLKPIIV